MLVASATVLVLVATAACSADGIEPAGTPTEVVETSEPVVTESTQEPEPEPSETVAEPVEEPALTSLFQTDMGYDAVGMMIVEDGLSQTFGKVAFDIPDWWEADIYVAGGYSELTYYGDPYDGSRFGFGAGLPPCDGASGVDGCLANRIDTLTGGDAAAFNVDTVVRESLPGGTITLLSQKDSGQDNGWSAVAFVSYDGTLHEFMIGDSRDLASILASLDSVRPA